MKIEVDYAGGDEERNEIAEDFVAPLQTEPSVIRPPKKDSKVQKPVKKSLEHAEEIEDFSEIADQPKKSAKKTNKSPKKPKKQSKKLLITLVTVLVLLATGSGVFAYLYFSGTLLPETNNFFASPYVEPDHYYSTLTGEELAVNSEDEAKSMDKNPTFCVQIPNGADGARPQVGLNKTAIVFEAIAEAGITRFAAVFQPNVKTLDQNGTETSSNATMIGPVRSLRSYYLDWDTPLDCTIVHAGGSPDAIAAVSRGYRDLSESTVFMWRDRNNYSAPNNLFTSSALLTKFNTSKKYNTSDFSAFSRVTPDEEADALASQTSEQGSDANESAVQSTDTIKSVKVNFGAIPSFNTVWAYDSASNSYKRSYASGQKHETYTCEAENEASAVESSGKNGQKSTTQTIKSCKKEQVVAKNIAVIVVKQSARAGDKKHRTDITTIGSGKAYIFKNGEAIKATWEKKSKSAQIVFKDADGKEISFNPGRLWIQAIPTTGSIKY